MKEGGNEGLRRYNSSILSEEDKHDPMKIIIIVENKCKLLAITFSNTDLNESLIELIIVSRGLHKSWNFKRNYWSTAKRTRWRKQSNGDVNLKQQRSTRDNSRILEHQLLVLSLASVVVLTTTIDVASVDKNIHFAQGNVV